MIDERAMIDEGAMDEGAMDEGAADEGAMESGAVESGAGGEGTVEPDHEELWAPFLVFRRSDPRADRLAAHARDRRGGQRPLPRRAAALSRDKIVSVAIAVADAEGASAISMRRIARELNAGTMSLYWHIGSKEELLDLMLDSVQGEMQPPEPSGNWRQDLHTIAASTRSSLHQHRWMMDFIGGRPPVGPKSMENVERALAVLDGLGLDKATAINVATTVATYVIGAVIREIQEITGAKQQQQQFAGLSDPEKEAMMREFVGQIRATARYPHLMAMIDAGIDPDAEGTRDARFEFGLGCLLDGIAARLRPSPAPPARA
jgi:AcrR family transcriptional regulator